MLTAMGSESEESMEKKTETRVGLGFAEALTLLFIALRLCGVIDWPWLWVLSPIWITLGFVLAVAVLIFSLKKLAEKFS